MTRIAAILAAGLLLVMAFRYALGCPCRRIDPFREYLEVEGV